MSASPGWTAVWETTVTVALLGTDRRPLPPAPPELDGLRDADAAVSMLHRVAALTAARRAGVNPAPPVAPPVPSAADHRPPCPPAASARLGELLADPDAAVLVPEWFDRIEAAGFALPPDLAVALLGRWRAEAPLRRRVLAAAGPVAAWLALQLPGLVDPSELDALGGDATGNDDERWRTGSLATRAAVLERWRRTDPDRARARLEAALAGAPANERARLVAVLATGLGDGDEPLLEALLDDRTPAVRAAAADLLARLPRSAFAARMAERVSLVVGADGNLRVPSPLPADWQRDGLGGPPPAGVSPGVALVAALAAAAPLAAWPGGPAVWLALIDAPAVRAGWVTAAARQHDVAWATALLHTREADPSLVAAVPAEVVVERAGRLATPEALLSPVGRALLRAVPRPWPATVAGRVTGTVVRWFERGPLQARHLPLLAGVVSALDPDLLVPLAERLDRLTVPARVAHLRDRVADLARLRHAMLTELP